jgi:hypothetical protein
MPRSKDIEEAVMGLVLEAYHDKTVRDNPATEALIAQLIRVWSTLEGWFDGGFDLHPRNDLLPSVEERQALFNRVFREQAEMAEDADVDEYPHWFPYAALPAWLIEGTAVIAAEHR